METMYYIGLDVHKKTISYCVKDGGGRIYAEAEIPATRLDLDIWMKTLPQPWTAAMEATIFTSWIYDHLLPHAAAVKVAHPLMLRAIAAAKKKNDRIDANKIADCLRCDFLLCQRLPGNSHALDFLGKRRQCSRSSSSSFGLSITSRSTRPLPP
jgi:transposase